MTAERHEVTEVREKGLLHHVGLAVSGAILLLVVALALIVIVIPKVVGATPLTVLTSSMEPRLPPGTLLIVSPVHPQDIRVGDVVTYQIRSGEPGVITHRVIAINSSTSSGRTFVFKGDNNSDRDPDDVVAGQIHGRVWYSVPLIGYVSTAVNGENKSWIIPVAAVLLFAYSAYMIASSIADLRRRRIRVPVRIR